MSFSLFRGWNLHVDEEESYSFEAAGLSANQMSFPLRGRALWDGSSPSGSSSPNTLASTSAFPAPFATKVTFAAACTTGMVKVIRSGGGFGESVMGAIHLSFTRTSGWWGKSEQQWPSGPIPSSRRSNRGYPSNVATTPVFVNCLMHTS
jgi:hypothetical protein